MTNATLLNSLFKDLKSTSFNLHKTRLKDAQQVSNLIITAALAFILLTILAMQYDQDVWRKKVQRIRKDKKVLSFFTFAYKLIDYFLENDIGFNFFSKFQRTCIIIFNLCRISFVWFQNFLYEVFFSIIN